MAEKTPTYTSHCACKKISVELYGEPVKKMSCSCNNCQFSTGSPLGGLYYGYLEPNLKIVDPEKLVKKWDNTDTLSGEPKVMYFCTECGTNVGANVTAFGPFWSVPVTQIDGWKDHKPTYDEQFFADRRVPELMEKYKSTL